MRLLFFGRLQDLAGGRERECDASNNALTIAGLIKSFREEEPALATALEDPAIRVAVNEVVTDREASLRAGDEVAFLPPASGG